MAQHEIKLDIKYFDDVKIGKKNFEIRKNDRDYQIGDILELRAFDVESGEYQVYEKSMSWDYESDWEFAFKEMADTVKVKVAWVSNNLNNYNKLLDDAGIALSPDSIGLTLEIETVIADFFDDREKLAGYVVLGIEVVE